MSDSRIKYLKKHLSEVKGKITSLSNLTIPPEDNAMTMLKELRLSAEKELTQLLEEKKNG